MIVSILANISENFISGETYNIASQIHHSIEDLVELILQETGADRSLVESQRSSRGSYYQRQS